MLCTTRLFEPASARLAGSLLLAGLLVSGLLGSTGCLHGPAPAPADPGAPHPAATATSAADQPFRPWQRCTDGIIGEDLFPTTFPERPGLLFSSNRHSRHYKLYVREGEGRVLRQITHGAGDDTYPAVAPAGERIAFASNRDGVFRIYLLEHLEDHQPRRLHDDDAVEIHPGWTPDGQAVVYSRLSPVTGEWEIWLSPLEGSPQRITVGLFPEVDPTGERIVFQRSRQRDERWYSIWTVRMDGTEELEIAAARSHGAVNPSWSPDGRWIAYNTVGRTIADASPDLDSGHTGEDVYIIRADGQQEQRLTYRPGPEWNPHWGRNGLIYFCAQLEGENAVWSVDPWR